MIVLVHMCQWTNQHDDLQGESRKGTQEGKGEHEGIFHFLFVSSVWNSDSHSHYSACWHSSDHQWGGLNVAILMRHLAPLPPELDSSSSFVFLWYVFLMACWFSVGMSIRGSESTQEKTFWCWRYLSGLFSHFNGNATLDSLFLLPFHNTPFFKNTLTDINLFLLCPCAWMWDLMCLIIISLRLSKAWLKIPAKNLLN